MGGMSSPEPKPLPCSACIIHLRAWALWSTCVGQEGVSSPQSPAAARGSHTGILQDTALAGDTAALGSWRCFAPGSSSPPCALTLRVENHLPGNIFSKQVGMLSPSALPW